MTQDRRAALADEFPWPSPRPGERVEWTGHGFDVGGTNESVLTFLVEDSGWTDDLTSMHERTSGATHPIDVASRGRAIAELQRSGFGRRPGVLLEVGCSSGYLLRDAREAFPDALVIGSDYVAGPLRALAAEVPTQPLLNFDLTRCPLPDASLDAIVALNVLEHIEDDRAAVREMFRTLKPGAIAVIELPAIPGLYDVYDKFLMHHRRYSMAGARRLFEQAGFDVVRPSHIGFFVFPAFAAIKLRNKRYLSRPAAEQRAVVEKSIMQSKTSRAMGWLMQLETWGSKRVQYPLGVRCVLTAVKPRG
jgi:SAM-dependent methyltransferase